MDKERRLALPQEFDRNLEGRLRETAQQRLAQTKTEKARTEAHINQIRNALGSRETKVANTGPDIQDLDRRLKMDEEVLDRVNHRLRWFEYELDRRPRVQIASLAEIKVTVDNRWRWTFVTAGAAVLLGTVLLIVRRAAKPRLQPSDPA